MILTKLLEFTESLPDGHPADAERVGEVPRGREPHAWHELTRGDRACDLLCDRYVQRPRAPLELQVKWLLHGASVCGAYPNCLDRYAVGR